MDPLGYIYIYMSRSACMGVCTSARTHGRTRAHVHVKPYQYQYNAVRCAVLPQVFQPLKTGEMKPKFFAALNTFLCPGSVRLALRFGCVRLPKTALSDP